MSNSKKSNFDYTKIKIKQEKLSPPPPPSKIQKNPDEVMNEIIPKLFGTPPRKNSINTSDKDGSDGDDGNDNETEKKSIEPVKSSNEILAELFKVFNAAPPETLLNDEYLLQKKKKHKKVKKHKKKSSKKNSSDDEENDEALSDKDSTKSDKSKKNKHKKKKKKKSSEKQYDYNSNEDDDKYLQKSIKKEKKISPNKKSDESDFIISDDDDDDDDENYSRSQSSSSRHVKIENESDDLSQSNLHSEQDHHRHQHHHHHHRHHHRHHHHNSRSHCSTEKEQQNEQQEKNDLNSSNSRKIIIKSVKDSKVFKDAEEKQRESSKYLRHQNNDDENEKSGHDKNRERGHEREREREKEKYNRQESRRESSEISLSDEETYLKEKREKELNFYRNSNSFYGDRKSGNHRHYNDRSSRNRYRDSSRERSRSHYRSSYWKSRSRSRSRSRYRGRSRSRSTELVIDKKRLLEIARKNAISMFKNGSLPGTQGMSQEIKDKVLMRMRYGGKSVEELTEFCKKLSQGENLNDLSDLSSNEDSDHDKYGNEKAFHHPFVLKDRGPIVMNIKNATQIPPKTAEQTKAILMQFPVSSGQQHRLTENEWIPVSPKQSDPSNTTVVAPSKTQPPKNIFEKPLPVNEEQQPAFMPTQSSAGNNSNNTGDAVTTTTETLTTATTSTTSTTVAIATTTSTTTIPVNAGAVNATGIATVTTTATAITTMTNRLPPPPPPFIATAPYTQTPMPVPAPMPVPMPVQTPITVPPPPPPPMMLKATESVFPEQNQNIDVSTVIAKRLNAMRKLQENPTDPEALKMMYDAQKNMSAWANSKYTPGQFTGSTGANILTPKELTSGYQAWARRDQLTSTTPVSGGMGMHLLQKMGWKPGEGLGKTKNGALQPLLLDVKMDKRGLVATEEDPTVLKSKRKKLNSITQVQKNIEQKHPVSLLDEISARRKWGPPVYEVVTDDGPSHRKNFIFQVVVNDVIYQPTIPCRTKKEAKALAAKYCLQQLGILTC